MCRFAGEALQFYKRLSDAIARVGNNRTAGRIAVRSATACCLECGVRRSIWTRRVPSDPPFMAETVLPEEHGRFRSRGLAEQRQDALAVLVGDRERLNTELLLGLERLKAGRFRVHVGVDELADTAVH